MCELERTLTVILVTSGSSLLAHCRTIFGLAARAGVVLIERAGQRAPLTLTVRRETFNAGA